MSRLLYQAELHRRGDRPGPVCRLDRRSAYCQSPFTESNRRPSPYHGDALPTELKGPARRAVEDCTRRPGTARAPGPGALAARRQVRTNSRRWVAPGAAERTPVRASSQLSSRSSGSGRLTRKPCSLSHPICVSAFRVSSSSTPSATTCRPRLCASSMIDRAMNDSPWLVDMPSTNDLSILTSSIGSWDSEDWDSEE